MDNDERFEFDTRENGFAMQLPSVLMTAAAIGLIVLVNARAPDPMPASAPAASVQSEAARPDVHDRNRGGDPQAAIAPMPAQRSPLPL